jgi:anti-sigma factor ChrR (cupin superfamily)
VRGHADAATLAAFREELLSARKAAQVSAHLAACPRCAALEAQLAEVTTLLNRATAPPMPDALTARIQAALAAEAAARNATTAPHAAPAPEAVPAMAGAAGHDGRQGSNGHRSGAEPRRARWRGHDRSWLALRVAAVTAVVAVIAGGGYGVTQLLSGGSPTPNGATSGAGVPAPNVKIKGPIPRMSGGFNAAPNAGSGSNSRSSAVTMAPLVTSSGTNYQPTSLGAQASTVLKRLTPSTHSSPKPLPAMAPSQVQESLFPHLQACLIHIGHGQRPQLVDLAHYLGHPALIVVLPATNGAQPKALVIARGCTATTAHILATAPLPHSG